MEIEDIDKIKRVLGLKFKKIMKSFVEFFIPQLIENVLKYFKKTTMDEEIKATTQKSEEEEDDPEI